MLTICCKCEYVLDGLKRPARPMTEEEKSRDDISHGYCLPCYDEERERFGLPPRKDKVCPK